LSNKKIVIVILIILRRRESLAALPVTTSDVKKDLGPNAKDHRQCFFLSWPCWLK